MALVGLLFVGCGLWAYHRKPGHPTLLFGLFCLATGIHWGGTFAVGSPEMQLFQIVIYFGIWIVLTVFAFVVGVLFHKYPGSVIPVNFEIIVALVIGYLFYKKNVKILF